jgi:uncharacterized protein RhaS with RHS repeats
VNLGRIPSVLLLWLLLWLGGGLGTVRAYVRPQNPCTGDFRGVVSGARYYNPSTGRWISHDPLEEDGGNNLYAFNWNDPINQVDPTGLYTSGTAAEETVAAEEAAGMDMAMGDAMQALGIYMRVKNAVKGFNTIQRNLANFLDGDISEEDLAQAMGDAQDYLASALQGKALGLLGKFGGSKLGVGAGKRGPKTGLNGPHNQKIKDVADKLEASGNRVVAGGKRLNRPEAVIPTPGGYKQARRPDVLYQTPGGNRQGVNVGKTRANGTPVKRETEALNDLNKRGGVATDFIPYDR